jgi:hypothetical protein
MRSTRYIIPGIFLMLRSYTKVTVLRNVDLTDCKYLTIPLSCFNLLHGADFVIVAFASTMSPHLSYEVLTTAVDLRRELGYGKTDHVPCAAFHHWNLPLYNYMRLLFVSPLRKHISSPFTLTACISQTLTKPSIAHAFSSSRHPSFCSISSAYVHRELATRSCSLEDGAHLRYQVHILRF